MRKVFAVLLALSLSGLFIACSDDDTTITPTPPDFGISTTALATGYTCAPYSFELDAVGGTGPYTWSLAPGSSLPSGISLSEDGVITGLMEDPGSWTFDVVCTDAAGTPNTDQVELTLDVEVPANPSVAIFYDTEATVCGSETMAFTPLDCYVFIMLEDGTSDCAFATEFKISMEDENGDPLVVGTDYTYSYVNYSDDVALNMGDPFNGVACSFSREMYYSFEGNLHVLTFGLLLLEDLDNLAFKVGPSPSSGRDHPIIAACDEDHTVVEVTGRASALNYVTE